MCVETFWRHDVTGGSGDILTLFDLASSDAAQLSFSVSSELVKHGASAEATIVVLGRCMFGQPPALRAKPEHLFAKPSDRSHVLADHWASRTFAGSVGLGLMPGQSS